MYENIQCTLSLSYSYCPKGFASTILRKWYTVKLQAIDVLTQIQVGLSYVLIEYPWIMSAIIWVGMIHL